MKKNIVVAVFLFTVIVANSVAQTQAKEQVYIVGNDDSDAVYWLNGQKNVLPKTGRFAEAHAIAISGSNVYIAGMDFIAEGNTDAVYWLNGIKNVLPKTGSSAGVYAIAVSGSNVYIAGYDGSDAVYWLNGQRNVLQKTGSKYVHMQ